MAHLLNEEKVPLILCLTDIYNVITLLVLPQRKESERPYTECIIFQVWRSSWNQFDRNRPVISGPTNVVLHMLIGSHMNDCCQLRKGMF